MTVRTAAQTALGARLIQFDTREAWLDGRREGARIGGSDVPKILGVSPYGSPWDVWASRNLGIEKTYSDETLKRFARGHRWESRVLEDYQEDTGLEVLPMDDAIILHPSESWAASSPDAFTLDGGELGGAEAKLDASRKLWGDSGTVIEAWEDGSELIVRPDYALQVYWYLEASGLPFWDLAVSIPRGFDFPELRTFRIMRDPSIQARILDKVGEWRERYLLGGEEPDPDGSEAAQAALLARFPGRGDKVTRAATDAEERTILEYAAVKAQLKDLEERKSYLGQVLQRAIGNDYGLTLGRSKVLWVPVKGRAGLDAKGLEKAHPKLVAPFKTTGKPYRSIRTYGFDD